MNTLCILNQTVSILFILRYVYQLVLIPIIVFIFLYCFSIKI